jgi:hypothetical protein
MGLAQSTKADILQRLLADRRSPQAASLVRGLTNFERCDAPRASPLTDDYFNT